MAAENPLSKSGTSSSDTVRAKSDTDITGGAYCASAPVLRKHQREVQQSKATPGKTHISADHSSGSRQHMTLEGNVKVKYEDRHLWADKMVYDRNNNQMSVSGKVLFSDSHMALSAQSGKKEITTDRGEFNKTRFWLKSRNARVDAEKVRFDGKQQISFTNLTYTTCTPKNGVWELKAKRLKLDKKKGRGQAKHVVVKVKKIPIFYLPSMSFPIDKQRKSGFLIPGFGNSSTAGSDIRIPFYWNIAPNRDMTITARFLNNRGGQLAGEYRYLHEKGRGVMGFEYLPNDDILGRNRHRFFYRNNSRLGKYWSTSVDINSASDGAYLEDMGANLADTGTTHLERRIDLNYSRSQWSVLARFQNYQPLKNVTEVYQRLPQLLLTGDIAHPSHTRLTYHFHAEAVRFQHENNLVTGLRLDLMPGLSYKILDNPGYYLTTTASYRHTEYRLENQGMLPENPNRGLPVFSLDSGLFFDRYFKLGKNDYKQTFEPRIFYVYVPYRDQSNLPVFDTTRLTFDINQLFRTNRYSGADRQGDANQVTLALTSRFIDRNTGRERFRATIGQITYFDDRIVTLPTESIDLSKKSDAVAEVSWQFTRNQRITAATQWDLDRTDTKVSILEYQYKRDKRHLLNIAYRFRENNIEQTDISSVWSLGRRWNAVGRWNYSISDRKTLEGIAGIEYNNCCWAIRLIGRTYIRDINADKETSFHLQFVLKGLTKLGDNISTIFKKSIAGYEDTFQY